LDPDLLVRGTADPHRNVMDPQHWFSKVKVKKVKNLMVRAIFSRPADFRSGLKSICPCDEAYFRW
jgi:hypothetical protein